MERKIIETVVYKSIDGIEYPTEERAIQADKNYVYNEKIYAILVRLPRDCDPDYYKTSGKAHAILKLIEDPNRIEDMIRAIGGLNAKYKSKI